MTIYHIEHFIDKGKYKEMKHLEFVTSKIKENIRLFQMETEEKRIEWKEQGVVSKFVSCKEYDWDKDFLKELFFDLGILIEACSICNERLSDYQLTTLVNKSIRYDGNYVRFTPNKLLKFKYFEWFAELDIPAQLLIWKEYHKKLEVLLLEWDKLRKIAAISRYC